MDFQVLSRTLEDFRDLAARSGGPRKLSRLKGEDSLGPGKPAGWMLHSLLERLFCHLGALLFSSLFRCLFGSIFGEFSIPTCLPKSTKIAQKSMPRCLPMLNSFFDRFLIDFCSQLGPPEPKKSSPRCRESTIFQKSFSQMASIFGRFGCQHSSILASKILPKPPKNRSQDPSNF